VSNTAPVVPVERFLGAAQVTKPHADLAERGERDAEPVWCPGLFLQLDAALGQRQRLIVPVLHQGDVCLVAANRGEHVAGVDDESHPLGLPQSGHRFVETPLLRERNARQRVHHRQLTAVASRVQGRGGLGQMLAEDCGVADAPVAEGELVMNEANRPRFVGAFGSRERLTEERDSLGWLAPGSGKTAVHAPQVG
jgi:hypothetical protein